MLPKLFLDPGDWVIAGRPTYIGAIQAIQSYRGKILGIPFGPEKDGFDMVELERRYAEAKAGGARIKYIYVIPDFQNPTGICWSLEKRKALLEFSYREGLILVEDSPYREIRFMGESVPSIYQLDSEGAAQGNVINLKTFSKILAPGTRIGWLLARPDIIDKFVTAKQAMDLCTSSSGWPNTWQQASWKRWWAELEPSIRKNGAICLSSWIATCPPETT